MIKNRLTFSKIGNYFKKNDISINEVKRYLKKKGFVINKKKLTIENNFGTIAKTFLSCLVIISIFSITPLVLNFTKEKVMFSKIQENNSKNKLKKLLKDPSQQLDNGVAQEFLFDDVLNFDEQRPDTVRLSAATIIELFKSTGYSLKDVRKNKLVKPISLTLLPQEIIKIENSNKRKNLFIQIILPLVIKENN